MKLSRTGWRSSPQTCALRKDAVHVWRARLDRAAEYAAIFHSLLSPDESAKVARFLFEEDRTRALISRGLLRMLLGHYLTVPAASLRFDYSPFGKPGLANIETPLRFNVSHSGELLLVGFSLERALGVDVERIRENTKVLEIAQRFFSENERSVLAALPASLQRDAFFACWTRKEAYIKAKGEGLSLPLDAFDVSFLADQPAKLIATRPDAAEAERWDLRDIEVAEGYKAALAVEGRGWILDCRDWTPE
jgi:4'-phosphopantetheinyl transferase